MLLQQQNQLPCWRLKALAQGRPTQAKAQVRRSSVRTAIDHQLWCCDLENFSAGILILILEQFHVVALTIIGYGAHIDLRPFMQAQAQ